MDLAKLQDCLERIEEALTMPSSDEQIQTMMEAWEEGDKIVQGITEKANPLDVRTILEMHLPAINGLTLHMGVKFIDKVNDALVNTDLMYLLTGDGVQVVTRKEMMEFTKAMWKAEEKYGSSIGWDRDTFIHRRNIQGGSND